jgi:hypothetical protein
VSKLEYQGQQRAYSITLQQGGIFIADYHKEHELEKAGQK